MTKGWHNEPRRHALASKGIKTTSSPQKNLLMRNYGRCPGCGHMLTEPNYCSYCQGVDKIESGVGVKGNENKGLYIVRINGEVKANISAVNKKDADNQWQMLKTMVKGGRNPNYTISIEKKEEKIFDLSTTKGLQAAERYKAKLEKQYDEVTTSLIGNDKISIYAGR